MVIQIQISDEVWKSLNQEKRIRETFDNVLRRKLGIKKCDKEETKDDNTI